MSRPNVRCPHRSASAGVPIAAPNKSSARPIAKRREEDLDDIKGLRYGFPRMLPDRVLRRLLRSEPTFALFGDLVRALAGIAVVICFGAWIAYYMFIVPTMFNELHMNDFGKFYYSTQLYLDGQGMYGPSPATEMPVGRHETRQLWNLNPPHFHLLILPLAGLSPLPAYALWSAINIVALGLTLV